MTSSSDSLGLLRQGTTVGNTYEVCAEIGRGGMGVVYEVQHKRLPQRFAIKVIRSDASEESLQRFRREAEIVSSLGHGNILRIIDFNTLPDDTPYMVMEFLDGEDLEKHLAKGRLSVEQGLSIASQMGSALQAAHDQGIVHRDLKPANVFVTEREANGERFGHVTILDFGISKVLDSSTMITHTDFMVGTPQYMAPEQALGDQENISAKSDQFSMACVVYEVFCGQKAFSGVRLPEVVYQVCHQDPPNLATRDPKIPIEISQAVERAMSKEHSERFADVSEFVKALHGQGKFEEGAKEEKSVKLPSTAPSASEANTVVGQKVKQESRMEETGQAQSSVIAQVLSPAAAGKVGGDSSGEEDASLVVGEQKSRVLLWFGAAALLLGFGLAFVMLKSDKKDSDVSADRVQNTIAPAAANTPDAGRILSQTNVLKVGADGGIQDAMTAPDAVVRVRRLAGNEAVPVSADLLEAKRLLKDGQFSRARQSAKKVLRTSNAGAGFVITVKSFCGEGKQGTAQDWLARVPRGQRRSVISYCRKAHQVELVLP